ncbi:alpha/beta hydrolase [Kribbella sp. NPDC048915]|uniref:alpha/beta hydrolase n=1 Tax=Kribbella sp. NPDC048915 TaxID=3155148 RepID=UPI0033F54A76
MTDGPVIAVAPEVAALLARRAASGAHTLPASVEDARRGVAAYLQWQAPPEPVDRVVNLSIPVAAGRVPIRIYYPAGGPPYPAVVHFHGGGWTVGDLDLVDVPLRALANRSGWAVISVGYRLAPEHPFPVPLDDCYRAVCWVAANAARLTVDADRLAVSGDSAGANLAGAVCLRARDEARPPLTLQVLMYPPTDSALSTPTSTEYADGYLLSRPLMRWYWRQYAPDPAQARHPLASLLRAELAGLPPAFVATASCDLLRDDGERYAENLRAAGVQVDQRRYAGTIHGFFLMNGVVPATTRLYADIAAALRRTASSAPRT